MASLDPYTWYVLQSATHNVNNTLTASNNTQTAFDPNSPSAVYYAPASGDLPQYQQWQLYPVNSSTSSAFVLRNRLLGADAYLTTAETTRKCGGGNCATVPVLSSSINNESLWAFASWGWSDATGGAYVYNLGNGSTWRLDVMDGESASPEMLNFDDTGRLAQHWTVSAYTTFAASDSSSFAQVPSTATALVAQYAGDTTTGSITPYTVVAASATTTSGRSLTSATGSTHSSSVSHSGLSTSAAIGIGVGIGVGVLVLLIGLALGLFCYRKRKAQRAGTYSTPAGPIHDSSGRNQATSIPSNEKKYVEMQSPIEDRGAVHKAEMIHPSEPTRPELSAGHIPRPLRAGNTEMPHPSESTRSELEGTSNSGATLVELEHPSTRI